MRTGSRTFAVLLTGLALLTAVAGCAPSSGELGSPSTPAPTGNASVPQPSGDATPGATGEASPSTSASTSPSTAPSATASAGATASPSAAPTASPTASPTGTIVVRAYFMLGSFTGNAGLVPVLREIPTTAGVAAAAMRQLIAGPISTELSARPAMFTSVPPSTKLLGISISGGVATVNLSKEYETGFNTATPDARDAQVVYTLTQFSTVTSVVITVEGQGASGSPRTRESFRDDLPAIFVDRPAWGAAAGNPARIAGVANVFEATFRAQLKDASGRILVDQQVMASCGTGCWGDFSVLLSYTVGQPQWGTLRVYDLSAKDGSVQDVTEYPVWLVPAG